MDFMESSALRSANCGVKTEEIGIESFQFREELQRLTYVRPENGSSFTALLKLPANQAMELICSPEREVTPAMFSREVWVNNPNVEDRQPYHLIPMVRANTSLGEGASNFSVFASAGTSPGTISIPHDVKHEPLDSDSIRNSSSAGDEPMYLDRNQKLTKRKEREKKVNPLAKKSKNASNATSADGEKLPYVHVRARRGQATDSHSLAERARREKINARMKLLKELVPGANKISGTALVLDEIINHVQFLQSQVEFLSMRLAAVNSRIDFNLDGLLAAESLQAQGRCPTDSNYPGVAMPSVWPEQLNGNCQPPCYTDGIHQPVWRMKQDSPNFVAPDNSLLIYDEILNSASLQLNQLKMEL